MKNNVIIILITLSILSVYAYISWFPVPIEPPYKLVKTWGKKGSTDGLFNEPTGIALSVDKIFVSDARNARIQVFDLEGNYLFQFGNSPALSPSDKSTSVLKRPMNLTIANNELFVADLWLDHISVYSLDGKFRRNIGNAGDGPSGFNSPGGVAVNDRGELFVADFLNQRVQQLSKDGTFIRQWGQTGQVGIGAGQLNYPTDVAIGHNGLLYIADGYNDRVQVFGSNGEFLHKWGGPFASNIFGPFNGWFATVTGITVGPNNNIFVADFYNDRVQKFAPDGQFLNSFGIKSNGPTHTSIAVAVSINGDVYVTDYAHHQIQKWRQGSL